MRRLSCTLIPETMSNQYHLDGNSDRVMLLPGAALETMQFLINYMFCFLDTNCNNDRFLIRLTTARNMRCIL